MHTLPASATLQQGVISIELKQRKEMALTLPNRLKVDHAHPYGHSNLGQVIVRLTGQYLNFCARPPQNSDQRTTRLFKLYGFHQRTYHPDR